MPLYEYACRGCGKTFEMFVTAERTPSCPACNGADLARLLSSPGMVGAANGRTSSSEGATMPGMCRAQGGRCACE